MGSLKEQARVRRLAKHLVALLALLVFTSSCDTPSTTPNASELAPDSVQASPTRAEIGTVIWRWEMDDSSLRPSISPKYAAWIDAATGTSLKVKIPPDSINTSFRLSIPIDLRAWRGMGVEISCDVVGSNLVSTRKSGTGGANCELGIHSPAEGDSWLGSSKLGTFTQTTIAAIINIPYDATGGRVYAGINGATGQALISNVKIRVSRYAPIRPLPLINPDTLTKFHSSIRLRGFMLPSTYLESNMSDLQSWNANAIRVELYSGSTKAWSDTDTVAYEAWLTSKLPAIDGILESARSKGIKVILDMHSPPGGRASDGTHLVLSRLVYQEIFRRNWLRLANRYKYHPALWGFDLLNEPSQGTISDAGVLDFYHLQEAVGKDIRKIDSMTPIIFESDGYASPTTFKWLSPINVSRVIYEAHMYMPMEYTHQGVQKQWDTLNYPGMIGKDSINAQYLRRVLQPLRDYQLSYGVPVIIGEFSAVRWAPNADRYISDCIQIFEEYGWDWTYHAFREWSGWSLEAPDTPYVQDISARTASPTKRQAAVREWLNLNTPEFPWQ